MIEGEELKGWSGEGRKNAAIVADLCRAATAKELSNTDPKFPRLGTAEITRNCSFELKPPPPPSSPIDILCQDANLDDLFSARNTHEMVLRLFERNEEVEEEEEDRVEERV